MFTSHERLTGDFLSHCGRQIISRRIKIEGSDWNHFHIIDIVTDK